MIKVTNDSTVDIIDRNVKGQLYSIRAGESKILDSEAAKILTEAYGFLRVSFDTSEKELHLSGSGTIDSSGTVNLETDEVKEVKVETVTRRNRRNKEDVKHTEDNSTDNPAI